MVLVLEQTSKIRDHSYTCMARVGGCPYCGVSILQVYGLLDIIVFYVIQVYEGVAIIKGWQVTGSGTLALHK